MQTTGLFSAVGDNLFFRLPSYGNYFVANRFHRGFGADWPWRLPDLNQAKLWLGLTVSEGSPKFRFLNPPEGWIEKVGVEFDDSRNIQYESTGIVYSKKHAKKKWSAINSESFSRPRAVLRASLEQGSGVERYPGIRISLNIVNRLGLHARASAKLVTAVSSCVPTAVRAVCRGRSADAKSIMEVMMLAADKGSIVDLVFLDATQSQIDKVRSLINGKTPQKNPWYALIRDKGKGSGDIWNVDFGEHYFGQGRVEYN